MVTYIDVRLLPVDLFTTIELISDKRELAENPAPYIKKEISDLAQAEKKRGV